LSVPEGTLIAVSVTYPSETILTLSLPESLAITLFWIKLYGLSVFLTKAMLLKSNERSVSEVLPRQICMVTRPVRPVEISTEITFH